MKLICEGKTPTPAVNKIVCYLRRTGACDGNIENCIFDIPLKNLKELKR